MEKFTLALRCRCIYCLDRHFKKKTNQEKILHVHPDIIYSSTKFQWKRTSNMELNLKVNLIIHVWHFRCKYFLHKLGQSLWDLISKKLYALQWNGGSIRYSIFISQSSIVVVSCPIFNCTHAESDQIFVIVDLQIFIF